MLADRIRKRIDIKKILVRLSDLDTRRFPRSTKFNCDTSQVVKFQKKIFTFLKVNPPDYSKFVFFSKFQATTQIYAINKSEIEHVSLKFF